MKFIKTTFGQLITNGTLLGRIVMILAILGILALAIVLSGPKPDNDLIPLPTPTAALASENSSAKIVETLAYDPFSDYAQTTGVAIGAAGLVLILLLGTFIEIISGRKSRKE